MPRDYRRVLEERGAEAESVVESEEADPSAAGARG
jgi:hypothetical protein